jgi:pSer/pThr/pTyr-binding forkhead associated (FHA) protein/quercetin dioxygenase-like cupin family protein
MTTVKVTSGPAAGQSLDLDRELVVGREDADLTIADPQLSRRHVALRPTDAGVVVEDLGSTNGTVVDGQRLTAPQTVLNDATLAIGQTTLAIEIGPGEARTVLRRAAQPDLDVTRQSAVPPLEAAEREAAAPPAGQPPGPPPTAPPQPDGPPPAARPPAARRRIPALVPWLVAAVAIAAGVIIAVTSGSSSKTNTVTSVTSASSTKSATSQSASGPPKTPFTICPAKGICLTTYAIGTLPGLSVSRHLIGGPTFGLSASGPIALGVREQKFQPGTIEEWHRHPGSALLIITGGRVREYTQHGEGCTIRDQLPGQAIWEDGGFAHLLLNVGNSVATAYVVTFDPVGNNEPLIPTSKPPTCPR